MSIIFSKRCEYGLQAVLYVGARKDRRVGIKEIADSLNIPVHFLAKVMQVLSEKGILRSYKGVGGGFTLNGAPSDIRLIDVVEAIDGLDFLTQCMLGFPKCGGDFACPVHTRWGKIREIIREMLTEETVAHLMTPSKKRMDHLLEKAMEKADTFGQRS